MIEKEELLTLIPHSGKMMMLDRIKKYNLQEKSIEAEYKITEDCIFYNEDGGGVPTWVGFELIAQAISAYIGIRDRERGIPKKEPPTKLPAVGYVLGVSQMNISLPFLSKNSIIKINTRELEDMDPVYIFQGELFLNGQEVLSGNITVMEAVDRIKKE